MTLSPRSIGRRWRALAWCLALVMVGPPRAASATDLADEADLQFQLGAEAYQRSDFRSALEHFLASNRLVPNRHVGFNIARTFEQLKRYPDAYRYYVEALEGEKEESQRQRIQDAMARTIANVAIVKVTTDPPGATLYIDRQDLGPRGLAPKTLGLAEGTYRILAELRGYEPAVSEVLQVKPGQTFPVHLKLQAIVGQLVLDAGPRSEGASVSIDNPTSKPVGQIPLTLDLPPGRHSLFLTKPNHRDLEVPVEVQAKSTLTVQPTMVPLTGTLVVNADLRDALIEIDGEPAGFTPAVVTVPVGQHTLRVSRNGYTAVTRTVDVAANAKAETDIQLVRVEEVSGASRSDESVEDAASSVTIITREELRAMGYPTVAEALRSVRGMYVADVRDYVSAGFLTRPGDYNSRVLVLIDGASTNDDYTWSSYLGFDGRVDLDDLERIEIIRGPGSAYYGTGAELGVINLVTRRSKETSHTEASLGTAEYGVARARGALFFKPSEHAGTRISASFARASGRDFFFPEYAQVEPLRGVVRNNDSFDAATVNGSVWYRDFSLQWHGTTRNKLLPTGQAGTILGAPTRFSDTRGFLEARYEPRLTPHLRLATSVQMNAYEYRDYLPYLPDDGGDERTRYLGAWLQGETRLAYEPMPTLRLTVGGAYQNHLLAEQTKLGGPVPFQKNATFIVGAAYLTADISPTPWLKLSLGGRLDAYTDRPQSLSPRIAAVLRPSPRGTLKLIAGRAFRAPSTYEIYYRGQDQLPNPGLSPELCYSFDAEYTHRISSTVTATVESFANVLDKYIAVRPIDASGNQVQFVNLQENLASYGASAEVRRDWRQGWMLAAHGTLQTADYVNAPDRRRVMNFPPYVVSVRGAAPILGRALTLMNRLTINGPRWNRFETETDPPQGKTEAAVLWDAAISGETDEGQWRYIVGLYNVFDWTWSAPTTSDFEPLKAVPQNGRTFMATLSASF